MQSLLLETQHKWESKRERVCLYKVEARQRCTPGEKCCGRPPHEEGYRKEAGKSVAYSSSSGSLFNFGQLSVFWVPPPPRYIWPALGPSPTCMHKLLFQDRFQPRGWWGSLGITYYGMSPSPFWPPRSLSAHVSPLPQGWEICDLLILYSNRVYPLSVPAKTIIIKCP